MTLKVQHVDTRYIHEVWPQVEPWFIPVFEKSSIINQYSIDNLKDYIIRGEQILLVASDESNTIHGALALQWINYPKARIAFIIALGGKFISSKETHQALKEWVIMLGGTKIQGACRPSLVRLWESKLGYRPINTIMELDL